MNTKGQQTGHTQTTQTTQNLNHQVAYLTILNW